MVSLIGSPSKNMEFSPLDTHCPKCGTELTRDFITTANMDRMVRKTACINCGRQYEILGVAEKANPTVIPATRKYMFTCSVCKEGCDLVLSTKSGAMICAECHKINGGQ